MPQTKEEKGWSMTVITSVMQVMVQSLEHAIARKRPPVLDRESLRVAKRFLYMTTENGRFEGRASTETWDFWAESAASAEGAAPLREDLDTITKASFKTCEKTIVGALHFFREMQFRGQAYLSTLSASA